MYNLSPEGVEHRQVATIKPHGIKINQLDFDTGEIIDTYNSVMEAALDNYIDDSTLRRALKKRNGIILTKGLRFEEVK